MIRAVTFDVGGTLIRPEPSVGEIYSRVAHRHGCIINAEKLNRQFIVAWKQKADFDYSQAAWLDLVRLTFNGISQQKVDRIFPELYQEFTQAEAWHIFADVRPCLEKLQKQGVKLGLVSNWDNRLRPLLRVLDLERYFAAIIVSCEHWRQKPDPALFLIAALTLGIKPDEILHIGDSIGEDGGATTAGCQFLMLNRPPNIAVDQQISTLAQLKLPQGLIRSPQTLPKAALYLLIRLTRPALIIRFTEDGPTAILELMNRLLKNLFCSTLGKKYLMAVTGLLMILFVIGHMLGNLQIFLGPESINRYGNFLQTNVEVLWPVRIILLGIIIVHIWSASSLTIANRAARPVAYEQWEPTAATYASRTMMVSGIIVALFLIYHILHFTVMTPAVNLAHQNFRDHPQFYDSKGRHDIYHMMIVGFQQPLVCLFYILGVGLLCLHLRHGASAMWQSMGWKKRAYGPFLDQAALWGSVLLFFGYVVIPISIWLRWIQ